MALMRALALACASAALVSVAHRPWGTGYLAWAAYVPLIVALVRERAWWRGALAGWIASLGTGLVAFEGVVAAEPLAYPVLAAVAGTGMAVAGAATVVLTRRLGAGTALAAFPALVVAADFIASRRWLFGDVANGMAAIGYTQFATPWRAAARWSGVDGVSLLVAAVSAGLVAALLRRRPAPLLGVAAVAALAAWAPAGTAAPDRDAEPLRVGVAQGAVSSVDSLLARFDRDAAERMVAPYAELTRRAARRDADLVVWGETAIPQSVRPGHVPDYLAEALAPTDVALAGGVSFRDGVSYNALFHWNGARLREVYRKRALVPVNEWHYERGRALPPLALHGTALGLGICLDSVFGALARQAVRAGAEALVYVTEDSFAGRTVTPEMHLRVTAFRAAETARPAVFASQSGPSAVFDARGRVVQRLPHGEAAGAVVPIRPATAVTPYVRFGNLAGWASLAAAVLALAAAVRPRRGRRSATGANASGGGG